MTPPHPLHRLRALLPLSERQRSLDDRLVSVHRSVLTSFAATGRPGTVSEEDAQRLAALDLIVVDDGEIVGAYPFTLEPTEHVVGLPTASVHAMCSLDAVAIASVFDVPTRVESRCAVTGRDIVIEQGPAGVAAADPPSPWLGIRWQQTHGCAARSLCREMVFLADEYAARTWQGGDDEAASVFPLEQGIEYGNEFFGPLMSG